SVSVRGNTVRWTAPFLSKLAKTPGGRPTSGIEIGYKGSLDPAECAVALKDKRLDAPAKAPAGAALTVHAAVLNGQLLSERSYALNAAGASAAGLRSAGSSAGAPR